METEKVLAREEVVYYLKSLPPAVGIKDIETTADKMLEIFHQKGISLKEIIDRGIQRRASER